MRRDKKGKGQRNVKRDEADKTDMEESKQERERIDSNNKNSYPLTKKQKKIFKNY